MVTKLIKHVHSHTQNYRQTSLFSKRKKELPCAETWLRVFFCLHQRCYIVNCGSRPRFPRLKQKRESIWIIFEILEMAMRGATRTSIATKQGLNFKRASRHVMLLHSSGHLQKYLTPEGTLYVLTRKGENFLSGLRAIRADLAEMSSLPRSSSYVDEGQVLQLTQIPYTRRTHVPQET